VTNTYENIFQKLSNLRVDRAKGIAPHQPLLLLVVLELAKSGLLVEPNLKLMPDLAFLGFLVDRCRSTAATAGCPFAISPYRIFLTMGSDDC
jgi:hypothetical protein